MEQKNKYNQPAFPTVEELANGMETVTPGMTLLDYFAGKVISNLNGSAKEAIEDAYMIAAAMMEERKKYLG